MRRSVLRFLPARGSAARPARHSFISCLITCAPCVVASAPLPAVAQAEPLPTRSVWVTPTYQLLLSDGFEPSSRHGVGASLTYDFHVSPKFNLGLTLAYRLYPGASATQQLGYGVMLQHFFSADWSHADGVYPYVDYGLLLQQSFIEGHSSAAVSHDTRLGGGLVLRTAGVPLFVGVSGHYSRLQYFDIPSTWIPYLEVEFGWVHAF